MTSEPSRSIALELEVAHSRGGLSPHLATSRDLATLAEPRSLCKVAVIRRRGAWFALTGCKRCARAALKDGVTTIIDIDGKLVDLQDVLDGVVPD